MSRVVPYRAASSDRAAKRESGYLHRSQLPLTSLLFLLPLVIFYEIGTRHFGAQRVLAFDLLHQFFQMVGANGRYLPAMALVSMLVAWHLTRKDPHELHFGTAGGMLLESIALSLPIFALHSLTIQYFPLYAATDGLKVELLLSVGAGIYEEMVFRLLAFAVLGLVFVDLLKLNRFWSALLMVSISAVVFAEYHYWRGAEVFQWRTFVFRTAAGIYFAAVFYIRGFGITSGSHAAYDAIVCLHAFALTPA